MSAQRSAIVLLRRLLDPLHPLDRVPGVEEQPPAGSLVVVEHEAPVAHALQVAADLLRLAVLFPPHELKLYALVYPVVEFHQASSTLLDVTLSYRTSYATRASVRPPERLGHRGGGGPLRRPSTPLGCSHRAPRPPTVFVPAGVAWSPGPLLHRGGGALPPPQPPQGLLTPPAGPPAPVVAV